ncbi:hypothetical protein SLEP1_g57634 [Rubroshorea leprosula]|uniref:Uncharacterized protein n=1 Tax=Rubroshorea leprosula TaxID=152421 RepID=A0AAV5MN73_9ROSI|nr:hypothetical protein SLEP1_g57634 [Rubroshorea leprosula]
MAATLTYSYCKPSPFLGQFPPNFGKGKSSVGQSVRNPVYASTITALFWGSNNKSLQLDFSRDFTLPPSSSAQQTTPQKLSISVVSFNFGGLTP